MSRLQSAQQLMDLVQAASLVESYQIRMVFGNAHIEIRYLLDGPRDEHRFTLGRARLDQWPGMNAQHRAALVGDIAARLNRLIQQERLQRRRRRR